MRYKKNYGLRLSVKLYITHDLKAIHLPQRFDSTRDDRGVRYYS